MKVARRRHYKEAGVSHMEEATSARKKVATNRPNRRESVELTVWRPSARMQIVRSSHGPGDCVLPMEEPSYAQPEVVRSRLSPRGNVWIMGEGRNVPKEVARS